MRFFLRLTVMLSLLLPQNLPAQSTDSLANAVEANSRAIAQSAKEIQRLQDSMEKARILRNQQEHGQTLDDFLRNMREQEEKRQRRVYVRIGFAALFLIALIVAVVRHRRRKR